MGAMWCNMRLTGVTAAISRDLKSHTIGIGHTNSQLTLLDLRASLSYKKEKLELLFSAYIRNQ